MMVIKKNTNADSCYQYLYGDWKITKRLDGLNKKTLIWVGVKPAAWVKGKRKSLCVFEEFSLHQLRQSILRKEEAK